MNTRILSLKEQEGNAVFEKVFEWIRELTSQSDNEDGRHFTDFITRNLRLPDPYRVFVIVDEDLDDVVGIASLIPDDRGVETELRTDCLWIGGVNIRRQYRRLGYGTELIESIDTYLKNLVIEPLRVELFTDNPVAEKLYMKFGFQDTEERVTRDGRVNKVYSKRYH